jgi:hypothetical protein
MYKIETTDYGLKLTLAGIMDMAEASQFSSEWTEAIMSFDRLNAIIIDAREFVPVTPDVQEIIKEMIHATAGKHSNEIKIATILKSPIVKNISRRLSLSSEQSYIHRFIYASDTDDPEKTACDWAVKGIEPASSIVPAIQTGQSR